MQCTSVTLEACKIYWMPAVHLLIDDTQKSQYAQVYKITVQAQLFTKTVKCHQMKENTWLWVACCHCCVQLHVKCMSAILHVVFKYLNEPIIASQQNFFCVWLKPIVWQLGESFWAKTKGCWNFDSSWASIILSSLTVVVANAGAVWQVLAACRNCCCLLVINLTLTEEWDNCNVTGKIWLRLKQ